MAGLGKNLGPSDYRLSRAGRKLYSTKAERSRLRKSTSRRVSRNVSNVVGAALTSINDAVAVSSSSVRHSHAESGVPASPRRRFARIGVTTLAFALVGTFALPAYALTPRSLDAEYGQSLAAQSISAHAATTDASRPTSVSVQIPTNEGIVRPIYDGPTYRDFLANPPYPNVSLSAVFNDAAQYIGTPYLEYGATPAGFDCSGFTMFIYSKFGIELPHSASAQLAMGTPIAEADAQPGDLVWMPGHVGFWAAPGVMLDSPTEGESIAIRPIWSSYYIVFRVGI